MSFEAHDLKVAFDDGVKAERERIMSLLQSMIAAGERDGQSNLGDLIADGYLDIGEI